MAINNARYAAVLALCKVDSGGYSNLTLNDVLGEFSLSKRDVALATALFYGVLDRKITVDYILNKLLAKKTRIKPITRNAIKIGIYQIMFLDKIPHSAAVNESVNIVKASKDKSSASFVNALLRNVIRNKDQLLPTDNSVQSLSVRYSCPIEILNIYINDYGFDTAIKLLDHSLEQPNMYIRVNTLKITPDELALLFEKQGIVTKKTFLDNALQIIGGFSVEDNDLFKQGFFHVQDLSSQLCAQELRAQKNDRILDACAAPGGKTFTIAEVMENTGQILACDLHEHRTKLIAASANRLGLKNIKTITRDATECDDNLGEFDRILCDVPCSGLGVISRKPDIKYTNNSFNTLPDIQYAILTNSSKYLKHNGTLCYSTCTLHKAENEDVCSRFLNENRDYKIKSIKTYMPHIDGTDGFFVCVFERGNNS